MKKILIIGATSAIAEATARIWSQSGEHIFLVARNKEKLDAIANDLIIRGCRRVDTYVLDVNNFAEHSLMLNTVEKKLNGLDTVLIAHGTLSNQTECQKSVENAMEEINTNALSTIALLTIIANRFEQQKKGTIVIISSVSGDRGRQSNYVYGSAKAMVTVFTSGLMQRLYKSGVTVITIKPGFVDTPMTAQFKKGMFWASSEKIAKFIVNAVNSNRSGSFYTPKFWLPIMVTIKFIPDIFFKRLTL
jgi:short-subunit dehydrogenase